MDEMQKQAAYIREQYTEGLISASEYVEAICILVRVNGQPPEHAEAAKAGTS